MASDGSSTPPPDWLSQPPAAFDIVAAYYPETRPKGELMLRPCLVLDVLRSKKGGDFACRVAFGTKNLKFHRRHVDLIIQNAADLNTIGLPMATRFDLDQKNLIILPWTEEFFGCWRGYSHPRIGKLTEAYVKEYAYLMMMRLSQQS